MQSDLHSIDDWLIQAGLEHYSQLFRQHAIDLEELQFLSETDLMQMQIPLGHRKKILRCLKNSDIYWQPTQSPTNAARQHLPDTALQSTLSANPTTHVVGGERKYISILFADIESSSGLLENIDAESAHELLDPMISAMMVAVHRFEGTVNRVQGDGLMAMFGAPAAQEDHAVRACYAALAMQESIHGISALGNEAGYTPVFIRVGLHTGEAIVRSLRSDLSANYDAVGLNVHIAARMEQLATPGTVLLTSETYDLAKDFVNAKALQKQKVKGLESEINVYELAGVTDYQNRWQTSLAKGLTVFTGRDQHLALLTSCAKEARSGTGTTVCFGGEAGIGKSRLYHEFLCTLSNKDWKVLSTLSVSYGKANDWLPVVALCKNWFGISNTDTEDLVRKKVGKSLRLLDCGNYRNAFHALLGVPNTDSKWHSLGARQQRRVILDSVKHVLLKQSRLKPLVVIVEDLHWIDPETQTLLDELREEMGNERVLLLTNYRPEYDSYWEASRQCHIEFLDQLSTDSVLHLLDKNMGFGAELANLKAKLTKHCQGNVLFLEESLRSLEDSEVIEYSEDGCKLNDTQIDLHLEPNIQAQIAQRIDTLDLQSKSLLQTAAVIGNNVSLGLLQRISGVQTENFARILDKLQTAQFIIRGPLLPEPKIEFRHAHIHDVAYGSLLRSKRRQMHFRTGHELLGMYPEKKKENAEVLAKHFETGEAWQLAYEYHILAAEKSHLRFIQKTTLLHLDKAISVCDRIHDNEPFLAKAYGLKGDAISLTGDIVEGNSCYQKGIDFSPNPEVKDHIYNRMHRHKVVYRDGRKISYYVHGTGSITLVIVRIIGYDCALNQPMIEPLCQNFRVVVIDILGTGLSDDAPADYTLLDRIEDYIAVIRHLDCGAVSCLGVSGGDVHVAYIAANYPDLVDKIILSGAAITDQITPESLSQYFDKEYNGDLSKVDDFVAEFVEAQFSEVEAKDFKTQYAANFGQFSRRDWMNFLFTENEVREVELDITKTMIKLQHDFEILLLHGTNDKVCPYERTQKLLTHLPKAQHYAFEGKGHQLMLTATMEFCEVVSEFLLCESNS